MCTFDSCFIEKGYVSFYEDNTKILKHIDDIFRNWMFSMGGVEYHIPALIDKNVLEKCGYFSSFPQHLTAAAFINPEYYSKVESESKVSKEHVDICEKYFTPAACLHIYPMLEGKNLETSKAITTLARVYRYEQGKFNDITRLWDFTVREFVFVGTEEYVLKKLEDTREKVLDFAKKLGLNADIVKANDHFYPTKKNMVKERLQKANSLKYELSVPIGGVDVAIASFNFHDTHFSKPFNFDASGNVVTGCVGFGLERWIAAIMEYKVDIDKVNI